MSRPLHFFGGFGAVSSVSGLVLAFWMLIEKFINRVDVMEEHGPLMVFAAVLIVAGVQLVALGLLGELQVRHFHEPQKRAPYVVDRVLRTSHSESALAD
jgi:hypothetical protein